MTNFDTELAPGGESHRSASSKKAKTGYKPRPLQHWLHNNILRFCVLVCHRRFGKTIFAVNEIIDRALANPLRNPQYAYVAPTYKQAKIVAWQYFVDFTRFLPGVKTMRSELTIYIQRPRRKDPETGEIDADFIKITLLGADDPDSIRGIYLDGAVLDEYAQCDPIIWGQIVRPALSDRKKIANDMGIFRDAIGKPIDPWAMFVGTPKGQNHFYFRYEKAREYQEYAKNYIVGQDMEEHAREWTSLELKYNIEENTSYADVESIASKWPEALREDYSAWRKFKSSRQWFTVLLKASETSILGREEIDEMVEDMTPEQVEQELECSFTAAILGSFYGHIISKMREDGRITDIPYNPKFPVDTYWDLGRSDKSAIWFIQKIPGVGYNYIDYEATGDKTIEELYRVLLAKAQPSGKRTQVQEGKEEYFVGRGFRFGRHVWPHDGKTTDWESGNSRQEIARQLGWIVEIQPKRPIQDRINASRTRLKISRFDENYCKRGLECLYNYQREYDEKLMVFKKDPKHDWSSHGADAFGYSAFDDRVSYFPEDLYSRKQGGPQNHADMDYDELG